MKPEFVDALDKCVTFSRNLIIFLTISLVEKGKSTGFLKDSSKRKRKRDEIEEVKDEEEKFLSNK